MTAAIPCHTPYWHLCAAWANCVCDDALDFTSHSASICKHLSVVLFYFDKVIMMVQETCLKSTCHQSEPSTEPRLQGWLVRLVTAVKNCFVVVLLPCGTQQTYKLTLRTFATCCELVALIFSTRATIVRRIGWYMQKQQQQFRKRHYWKWHYDRSFSKHTWTKLSTSYPLDWQCTSSWRTRMARRKARERLKKIVSPSVR